MISFHIRIVSLLIFTVINININICNAALVPGGWLPAIQKMVHNVCKTDTCHDLASEIRGRMNDSVKPCDNFYKFACGNYVEHAKIPADEQYISAISQTVEKFMERLKIVLDEPSPPNEIRPYKIAKNYYKSCMNEAAIEKNGIETLKKIIKDLGDWPVLVGPEWNETNFNWIETVYKFHENGYRTDYFFNMKIYYDAVANEKKFRIGTICDARLHTSDYNEFMERIVVMMGGSEGINTTKELNEIIEFEKKLLYIMANMSDEKMENILTPMTVTELSKNYSAIPWKEYANKIFSPNTINDNDTVVVLVPSFISDFLELMNKTTKRVQANYVMWRAITDSLQYLNNEMVDMWWKYETRHMDQIKYNTRWRTCAEKANELLGTHALYIQKYFNKDMKKDVTSMFHDIKYQFQKIIKNANWIKSTTKTDTLDKVSQIVSFIGYPIELTSDHEFRNSYKNLTMSRDNFLENNLKLQRYMVDEEHNNLKKPFKKISWENHSLKDGIISAAYDYDINGLDVPAGIVQGLIYSSDRPQYINYGTLGFMMGHEMSHAIDGIGRLYDKYGNITQWWQESSDREIRHKTKCIIEQFDDYTPDGVDQNEEFIYSENEVMTDITGLKIAYMAYENWLDKYGREQTLPGLSYNSRQMFWISAATTLCTKYKDTYAEESVVRDSENSASFRLHGSISNLPEFAQDFDCPVETKMNPKNKCDFW